MGEMGDDGQPIWEVMLPWEFAGLPRRRRISALTYFVTYRPTRERRAASVPAAGAWSIAGIISVLSDSVVSRPRGSKLFKVRCRRE